MIDGQTTEHPQRRWWPYVLGLCVLALALRLGVVVGFGLHDLRTPFNKSGDEDSYERMSMNILEHGNLGFRGVPSAWRPPAYPVFLAGVYGVAGHSYTVARVVQCVLDSLMPVLVFATLWTMGRPRAGLWSGAAYAVYPFFIMNATELMTEFLVLILTGVLIYLLVRCTWRKNRRLLTAFAAGLTCGVLYLTRENNILLAPMLPVALWIGLRRVGRSVAIKAASLFLAGFLAMWGAYAIRNAVHYHRFVPTGSSGWGNVACSAMYAIHGEEWQSEKNQWIRQQGFIAHRDFENPDNAGMEFPDEFEQQAHAKAVALKLIKENPGKYFVYCLKKIAWVTFHIDHRGWNMPRNALWYLRMSLAGPYWIVAILGVMGLVMAWRQGFRTFVLSHTAITLACLVVVIMTTPWKRYRYVTFDFACVSAAGFALAALWDRIRGRRGAAIAGGEPSPPT